MIRPPIWFHDAVEADRSIIIELCAFAGAGDSARSEMHGPRLRRRRGRRSAIVSARRRQKYAE